MSKSSATPVVSAAATPVFTYALGGKKMDGVPANMPIGKIKVQEGHNPRRVLGDVEWMVKAIQKDGLLSPLIVRPAAKEGEYNIVSGHRRFKALKVIGVDTVPVIIRKDLADDDHAKAVAVAENSEDARFPLNAVELATVCADFSAKGWSVARISAECGMSERRVRSSLDLAKAPEDVQKQVADGKLSAATAIEVSKVASPVLAKIKKSITPNMSANDVKVLAKKAAAESEEGEASKTDAKSAQYKKGESRDASLKAWRGNREKSEMLGHLAQAYVGVPEEERNLADFAEVRGAIAMLLWLRNDLEDVLLPDYAAYVAGKLEGADKKIAKSFETLVGNEAAKYAKLHPAKPDTEEAATEADAAEEDAPVAVKAKKDKKPKKAGKSAGKKGKVISDDAEEPTEADTGDTTEEDAADDE